MDEPMSARGQFIVIEGLEGAGKSTAVSAVIAVLESFHVPYITTREPGGTTIGESLRTIVKNPEFKGILQDKTELLLMYASRIQLVEEVIKPALNCGTFVVADRFELSTYAYQGGGRNLDASVIDTLSQFCLAGFKPDLTLFLDLVPELGMQRAGCRGALDRIEQQDMSFFQKVYHAYKTRLNLDPNVVQIDASLDIDRVKIAIERAVKALMKT
jgi:dTMP kinase